MAATAAQALGARGEQLASACLQGHGLTILERNYRRRLGEIDLAALDQGIPVIAEVRARSSNACGGAAAGVDGRRQRRIMRAAARLLLHRDSAALPVRFDALVVNGPRTTAPQVHWLRGAFEA